MPKRKICDENAIVDIISRSPQAQGILQHFSDSRKREKVILWVMKNNKHDVKVLLFDNGPVKPLVKILSELNEVDFAIVMHSKLKWLATLDNTDSRYYTGNLRKKDGTLTSHGLNLTGLGKTQLLMHIDPEMAYEGKSFNDLHAFEVAWRNVNAFTMHTLFEQLIEVVSTSIELASQLKMVTSQRHEESKQLFRDQVELMVARGFDPLKARRSLQGSQRVLNEGIFGPGLSATSMVLKARPELGPDNRQTRDKIQKKTIPYFAGDFYHLQNQVMRYHQMIKQDQGLEAMAAAKAAKELAIRNNFGVITDADNNPLPVEEQAKLYFCPKTSMRVFGRHQQTGPEAAQLAIQ